MNDLFDFGDGEPKSSLELLVDEYLLTAPSTITYDVYNSTYGSEFELADICRSTPLPEGLTWDGKDQTVMNSNGVATDPSLDSSKRTWNYGGEMNTKPCTSIDEIVALYGELMKTHEFTVNNSCNLHNHMRIPGLDLTGLKRLVAYYSRHREEIIKCSDYIPTPAEYGFNDTNTPSDHLELMEDRYKHHTKLSKGTRHGAIEDYVLEFKLNAATESEFHAASCYDKKGKQTRSWAIASRGGINTLQMRRSDKNEYSRVKWENRPYAESGTIEFRMHHGTTDLEKYRNTLRWDTEIANAALNTGETPTQVYKRLFGDAKREDIFPEYVPFDPEKYRIFKMTKNDGSEARRVRIREIIEQLKGQQRI